MRQSARDGPPRLEYQPFDQRRDQAFAGSGRDTRPKMGCMVSAAGDRGFHLFTCQLAA